MRFEPVGIVGALRVDIEPHEDMRGFFARTFCEREFAQQRIELRMVQASVSYNRKRGTLRGMHYQVPPGNEAKLVRCTRGAVFDVIVDLRPRTHTFLRHVSVELSADNRRGLYIPPGVAHGFQTLVDDTEVFYQMTDFHDPALARGVRWNDPAFGIEWPDDERTIIGRDATYPDFSAHVIEELRDVAV
jgi:dTDP-4-dehydrorhamnose 3,5-epimerase